MFIELVDALRCPVPHEESWLVAAAMRMEARHIVDGTIGCPVCSAEYPIARGVVDFRRTTGYAPAAAEASTPDDAMRIAALLGLSDAQGFAVLLGGWGSHATGLGAVTELPLVLVDPPADITGSPGISVLRTDGLVPLAVGAGRALALDAGNAARVESGVRGRRTKGRILAPGRIAVPGGVKELARDDRSWVGEREPAGSPLIALHVRRG
jgi:hypothetical protein